MKQFTVILLAASLFGFCAMCKKDPPLDVYKTKHVILVFVDGARYTETWGNGELTLIPNRAALSTQGAICTEFYNLGQTNTCCGHDAGCTGVNEAISNNGYQYPNWPSILQYYRKAKNAPANKTWLITSKDKLHVLSDCVDTTMAGMFRPMFDCGVNGPFTGYRDDSTTFAHTIHKLQTDKPDLVVINFKEPDASGHAADTIGYVNGIIKTDAYIGQLWSYLQSDPYYAGATTLIVTNDHGRHTAGWLDGYVSHGDGCIGCRHIEFFAIGPDIKQNYSSSEEYELVDIPKTISQLLMFPMPTGTGRVMHDVLK